jgi:hypothetical protein
MQAMAIIPEMIKETVIWTGVIEVSLREFSIILAAGLP